MKILTLMVGLPRSGKTTAAKQAQRPIVNPDSIRYALHGQRFLAEAEPMVWAIAKCMVLSLFFAGHDEVILDATNTTRKRRDEWKSPRWTRNYFIIPTDEKTCIERAKAEGDEEIIPIIKKMAAQYEAVADDESDL